MKRTIDREPGWADEHCVEWTRGPLTGALWHLPMPSATVAGVTEVSCERCDQWLYTYREESHGR